MKRRNCLASILGLAVTLSLGRKAEAIVPSEAPAITPEAREGLWSIVAVNDDGTCSTFSPTAANQCVGVATTATRIGEDCLVILNPVDPAAAEIRRLRYAG